MAQDKSAIRLDINDLEDIKLQLINILFWLHRRMRGIDVGRSPCLSEVDKSLSPTLHQQMVERLKYFNCTEDIPLQPLPVELLPLISVAQKFALENKIERLRTIQPKLPPSYLAYNLSIVTTSGGPLLVY